MNAWLANVLTTPTPGAPPIEPIALPLVVDQNSGVVLPDERVIVGRAIAVAVPAARKRTRYDP
jgi:hypothetical protein